MIQCGFPILAEGQIGAFYPVNILFLAAFPVKIAYNYSILFHYALGMFFFFAYLKRIRISTWGAFWGTLIFLLGSTQGGYFYYNYISQKVVIWLPLTLILIDRLAENTRFRDAFWLAAIFALEIFAGYLQIAVYSVFFSCFYFLAVWFSKRSLKLVFLFALSGILAIFFSLVQLLPTYELAQFSSRALAGKDLAYVGSMLPVGFLTLFYPSWDAFLQSEFYVGILGLFFVFVSLFTRKDPKEKIFWFAAAFFLLMALGQYSPLYRVLVELTQFQGFRNPIKFLFFVTFSLAVLAAFGFDKFFGKTRISGKISGWFLALTALMALVPAVLGGFLKIARSWLLPIFQALVERLYYGREGHPHSLESYREKAVQFYDYVIQSVSLSQRSTLVESGILILSLAALILVFVLMRKNKNRFWVKSVLSAVLLFDLYVYGFTSIQTGLEPFDQVPPGNQKSEIVQFIQADKSLFRTMAVYTAGNENRKFPIFPSQNMLYGIQDIGIYSPLALREYKDFLADFGYANDSISFKWVSPESVMKHLNILGFMNVKYILSTKEMKHPDMKFILKEKDVYLYENKKAVSRAYFIPGFTESLLGFDQITNWQAVPVVRYREQRAELEFQTAVPGTLVLSDTFYPKWKAQHNGREIPIHRGGSLFRAVKLQPGNHHIIFEYKPMLYQWLGLSALAAFLIISLLITLQFRYNSAFTSQARRSL